MPTNCEFQPLGTGVPVEVLGSSGATETVRLALTASLLVVAFGGVGLTRADEGPSVERSPSRSTSSWQTGNRITLKMASRDEPGAVTYGSLIAANGDTQIDINEDTPSQK